MPPKLVFVVSQYLPRVEQGEIQDDAKTVSAGRQEDEECHRLVASYVSCPYRMDSTMSYQWLARDVGWNSWLVLLFDGKNKQRHVHSFVRITVHCEYRILKKHRMVRERTMKLNSGLCGEDKIEMKGSQT